MSKKTKGLSGYVKEQNDTAKPSALKPDKNRGLAKYIEDMSNLNN
jgi:hypothetical protein